MRIDVTAAGTPAQPALNPIVERLLEARGVPRADWEAFFDPSLRRLVDPLLIPGMPGAVDVILSVIAEKGRIVVFGDYDCDGVCATAILVTALRRLGADVQPFIPDRFIEGYGMTAASLERMRREQPSVRLVVTVDNGVNAVNEVAELRADGVSVVITDHHLPGPELPAADALVNPKVQGADVCGELCGAGIAFFLSSAMVRVATARGAYSGGKFGAPALVLAGLATVADLMPLTGQNRILVAQSLFVFGRSAPAGLKELLARAARRGQNLVSRDYGFALAPRINAAGRMASALKAYQLLTAEDREEARTLAMEIDNLNLERKSAEQRMDREAREGAGSFDDLDALVAADTPEKPWHSGVAGIVAARLMEDARIPVAVITGNHGSARAPDGYNVRDALAASEEALSRYGGHTAAGGFSVKEGARERFRELFSAACRAQREANGAIITAALTPEPDLWLEPTDLTMDLHSALTRLEPFGEGNREPIFGLRSVAFSDVRPIGADGRHLCMSFVNRSIPRAVWWGHGADVDGLRARSLLRYDIQFSLFVSDYGGEEPHVELRLTDVRPAASAGGVHGNV